MKKQLDFLSVKISYRMQSSNRYVDNVELYNTPVPCNCCKVNWCCNNHILKHFVQNQFSQAIPLFSQAITHHSSIHYSQQCINDCKNNLFYCCSSCLCNSAISFLHKVIVHKPFLVPLSSKGWGYTHVCVLMVAKQCWQKPVNSQLLGLFLYTVWRESLANLVNRPFWIVFFESSFFLNRPFWIVFFESSFIFLFWIVFFVNRLFWIVLVVQIWWIVLLVNRPFESSKFGESNLVKWESLANLVNHFWFTKLKPSKLVLSYIK